MRFWFERLRSIGVVVLLSAALSGIFFPIQVLGLANGSITVSAAVAPVSYVLVNRQNTVIEITSNSPTALIPKVYQTSFQGSQIPLSPEVYRQYRAIMKAVKHHQTGVVFPYPVTYRQAVIARMAVFATWITRQTRRLT